MRLSFAGAVALRRVFDTMPPGKPARFYAGDKPVHPYEKPDGLYVFVDSLPESLTVRCAGYQPETFRPLPGGICPRMLYPAVDLSPPPGWKAVLGRVPPGRAVFLPDPGCEIRVTGCEPEIARLRTRPGLVGGCLLWTRGDERLVGFILEKLPPDGYRIDRMPSGPAADWTVRRIYPARAEENGWCTLVVPEALDFNFETDTEELKWETG